MINSPITKYFTIKDLLSTDNYIIPIYQRDYAWENKQIVQLVQDIADSAKKAKENPDKIYYIGTLIAFEQKFEDSYIYQTIDGQQRLTTLTILLSYLKNEQKNIDTSWYKKQILSFDCRKKSSDTLDALFYGKPLNDTEYNVTIKQGYDDIRKCFTPICKETKVSEIDFCNYLFNNVRILRVLVPEDTDLNHYFEIMNSRGEQLEKHEILKAKCLEKLEKLPNEEYAFNLIWEACANMERYVQYGFSTAQRDLLFGNGKDNIDHKWNLIPTQETLYSKIVAPVVKVSEDSVNNDEEKNTLIWDIIKNDKNLHKPGSEESDASVSVRFNTIINFSNFLLHILKIQTEKDVPLDDKRLIDSFDEFLFKGTEEDQLKAVKDFGYNLLKGKLLYDKYIIKREFINGTDKWSLKRFHIYTGENGNKESQSYSGTFSDQEGSSEEENREILMLLSMFHVSTPTLVYKHWLNGALKWLFDNPEPKASDYKSYLENMAKAFLFDHYLSKDEPKDYYEIIYQNSSNCMISSINEINESLLNQGEQVENFIFNYLDYLLWQDYNGEKKYVTGNDNRVKDFEYTFRSSVEHYYPQHPIQGKDSEIPKEWLHNFGNLCLLSSSKNAKLNNIMPAAKKDYYRKSPTIDSIKQWIMMNYEEWDIDGDNHFNEIEDHYKQMKDCLFSKLEK